MNTENTHTTTSNEITTVQVQYVERPSFNSPQEGEEFDLNFIKANPNCTQYLSVYLLHPHTQAAQDWMDAHCSADGEHQYFGRALVVEPRYVASIFELAMADGLTAGGLR